MLDKAGQGSWTHTHAHTHALAEGLRLVAQPALLSLHAVVRVGKQSNGATPVHMCVCVNVYE
jgi:hypothetical protein